MLGDPSSPLPHRWDDLDNCEDCGELREITEGAPVSECAQRLRMALDAVQGHRRPVPFTYVPGPTHREACAAHLAAGDGTPTQRARWEKAITDLTPPEAA